ncbi:MAG TPA: hypothetical protein VMU38_10745 [Candidatus Binatia bacterium]|nr:hypothetical protein [Candidatus Binatia bacterium]
MLRLSSTREVLTALHGAREIAVEAYTLHGCVLRAVEAAARRGADVEVALEASPAGDARSRLAGENARVAAELRAAGASATLRHGAHAKEIQADGALFLDEKNWHLGDLVLRADAAGAASIATTKDDALDREARLLRASRAGDGVIVESESFGCGNPAWSALRALGRAGARPRLLVSERDLRGSGRERAVLSSLARDGVRVRVCKDSEKLAACGDRAWLGSANATVAFGRWNMTDWGLCTDDATIARAVRDRLEDAWLRARNL